MLGDLDCPGLARCRRRTERSGGEVVQMGVGKARVKMVQIDAAAAEKFFDKCGYVEPTEEGRQRAAEIAANRQDRAIASAEKKKKKAG